MAISLSLGFPRLAAVGRWPEPARARVPRRCLPVFTQLVLRSSARTEYPPSSQFTPKEAVTQQRRLPLDRFSRAAQSSGALGGQLRSPPCNLHPATTQFHPTAEVEGRPQWGPPRLETMSSVVRLPEEQSRRSEAVAAERGARAQSTSPGRALRDRRPGPSPSRGTLARCWGASSLSGSVSIRATRSEVWVARGRKGRTTAVPPTSAVRHRARVAAPSNGRGRRRGWSRRAGGSGGAGTGSVDASSPPSSDLVELRAPRVPQTSSVSAIDHAPAA